MGVLIFLGVLSVLLIWNRRRKIKGSEKFEKRLRAGLFFLGLIFLAATIHGIYFMGTHLS